METTTHNGAEAPSTEQTMQDPAERSGPNKAVLYRMVMDKHICPFGLKSRDLLKREGFEIEDNHLTTREETDAFKQQYDVKTTPQTWINGERIGGHLRDLFPDGAGRELFRVRDDLHIPRD